jgi:hypothetical protein
MSPQLHLPSFVAFSSLSCLSAPFFFFFFFFSTQDPTFLNGTTYTGTSFRWQIAKGGSCILRNGYTSIEMKSDCVRSAAAPPPPPAPVPPPAPPVAPPLGSKPHIIFFLADDYGHFNMGWRGNKEARTPNMDALVAEGVVLDRHCEWRHLPQGIAHAFAGTRLCSFGLLCPLSQLSRASCGLFCPQMCTSTAVRRDHLCW